jgi:hypothetical protein
MGEVQLLQILGLDFGFFNNRISGNVDFIRKNKGPVE